MVGEACLPSNAYYPRTPDYTLCSGVHVCWSEHSDSSFVYGFMILNYGFGTMTATTFKNHKQMTKQTTIVVIRSLRVKTRCSVFAVPKEALFTVTHLCQAANKKDTGKQYSLRTRRGLRPLN